VSGIYRKKVERLTEALNTPEDRNEAAEAIWALVEKITLRPGPNRGEIDATLQGELGTILGWIEGGGESVSQSPLIYKLFFVPARGNLRSWLPTIGPCRAPVAPQASAPSSADLDAAAARR